MIRRLEQLERELDELEALALVAGDGDSTWKYLRAARKAVSLARAEEHGARGLGGYRRPGGPVQAQEGGPR